MTTRTVALLTAIALCGVLHIREARAEEARAADGYQDQVRAANSQEKKGGPKAAPSVAGRWTMFVKGGPHGDMTMSLTLAQEGKKVSGTFATPHGDLRVEGEFVEATLTIATPAGGDTPISLTAKLKEGVTLEGYLSSQMGDMTWTASRSSEK